MDSMNLLPVSAGSDGLGAGGAAALGAFVGSWTGNGFGGWGGRGGAVAADAAVVGTGVVLDSVNNLQSSVNGVGLAVVNGQNSTNMAIANGLSSTYAALNNTMTQQLLAETQGFASVQSTLCQGFSGVNQSVYQAGVDTRFAINDLARQNAECCCEIKGAIAAEGAATRGLIQQQYINQLETQLCDAKSKIGTLESNAYLTASQAAQTQQIIQTVLAHLPLKVS